MNVDYSVVGSQKSVVRNQESLIKIRMKKTLLSIALFAACASFACAGTEDALPRIEIRDGQFYNPVDNEAFVSVGFNYARITPHPQNASVGWHANFEPGRYDAEASESMLQHLAGDGFNTVRVFIDHLPERGIDDGRNGISPVYFENLCDFIDRARRNGIYVVLITVYMPDWEDLKDEPDAAAVRWRGVNRLFMDPKMIRIKANYLKTLMQALESADPRHLSTVLAVDIVNEGAFDTSGFPLDGGVVSYPGPCGAQFNLNDWLSRKALLDAWTKEWTNECVRAIKSVAPDMLVYVSIFTPDIIGRGDRFDIFKLDAIENRLPFDPLVILESESDFLGIHFYGGNAREFERELDSLHFPMLRRFAEMTGKPMLVGEFGAIKHRTGAIEESALWMGDLFQKMIADHGFQGALYWTYDSDEQAFVWNAKYDNWRIYSTLIERLEQMGLKP